MKKTRRLIFIFNVLMALTLLASACANGSGNQGQAKPAASNKPKYGGELRIGKGANISFVDPQRSNGGFDYPFNRLYAAYLMEISESGELQPSVAESWSIPDPKTILIKIRPGIKFHDGTDLDAAAVKFSIERGKDPKTKAADYTSYQAIAQVDTPDNLTVKLTLTAPNASLLYTLKGGAGAIVSPTAVQKWGNDFEQHVVSAGPFEIEKYVPDAEMVFKRFDNYWRKDADGNKLPYLDRVLLVIIADPAVREAALEAGDIDINPEFASADADRVKNNPDISLLTVPQASMSAMKWYHQKPPLDNVDVRRAIAYAIDRDEIVKSIYAGHGKPATTALPANMWAFDPNIKGYNYDPAKAKELLTKAGYPNGGLKIKAGIWPGVYKDIAEAVQGQLKRVGIEMQIDVMDATTLRTAFDAPDTTLNMGTTGYTSYTDPDRLLASFFTSDGVYNPGRQKVPEVDKLVEQARTTYDMNERKKLYSQAQQIITDQVHYLFIVNADKFIGYRSYVKNFTAGSDTYGEPQFAWIAK